MDRTVNILKKPLTMTLIAIFFGFVVAGIILAAAGYPPVHSLGVLFNGVFSSPKHVYSADSDRTRRGICI